MAEETRVRGTMLTLQARIDATPTRETELVSLTRDYQTLQGMYATLLGKKEESRIAANLESRQIGEQFKILDPASVPARPYTPNRARFAFFGMALMVGLCVGFVAFREYHNATLRSEDDVMASIGLPVVAMIPVLTASRPGTQPGRARRMLVSLTDAAMVLVAALASTFSR
jgi:capsular polysaccharide biosynthesis protein